jgi:peroxiredoxin Q/BCP
MIGALTLVLLLPAAAEAGKLRVGDEAPAFSLPASTGNTIRLSEFKGRKKVVLAFYPKAFTGG